MRAIVRCGILAVLASLAVSCGQKPPDPADVRLAERYLAAVREHADTVLSKGRDVYGKPTPLFVDGLEIETFEPVRWQFDDHEWILSNFANHQELLRTLCGLSALTGDLHYREAAVETTRYMFDHLRTPNGLFMWGGHLCYDADADQWAGRRFHWPTGKSAAIHELKSCYPFYELMWDVDPEKTRELIQTFWSVHVVDWRILDFDRHGSIVKQKSKGLETWNRPFNEEAPVHFRGRGRTFLNAASDLYNSGAMLTQLSGEEGGLRWAEHLAERYVDARDPGTGLHSYHYSSPDAEDRLAAQIDELFPDKTVRETDFFNPNTLQTPFLTQLRIAESLGRDGNRFLKWTVEDLTAIGKTAYDESTGTLRVMLIDGTDLSGIALPKDGYFGAKGTVFEPFPAEAYFLAFATAARLSGDPFMWEMARKTARDGGLGDIGERGGSGALLNATTSISRPDYLIGMLELHRFTGNRAFLDHACRIADNILAHRFENGLFTGGQGYRYTRTSRPEPLALLHLAATLLKQPGTVAAFYDCDPYFACEHKSTEKTYSFDREIYTESKD